MDSIRCQVCNSENIISYSDDKILCQDCCSKSEDGHEYEYDRYDGHNCKHCGASRPLNWD